MKLLEITVSFLKHIDLFLLINQSFLSVFSNFTSFKMFFMPYSQFIKAKSFSFAPTYMIKGIFYHVVNKCNKLACFNFAISLCDQSKQPIITRTNIEDNVRQVCLINEFPYQDNKYWYKGKERHDMLFKLSVFKVARR